MKSPVTALVFASSIAFALVGCGPKDASPAAAATAAPVATAAAGPGVIALTAGDNMKYSMPRIEVTPGLRIKLTFTNTGTQPKNVMAHNFVLLKKDTDIGDFSSSAATAGKANDYIPTDDMADQMIAHSKSLGPKESETIEFTAPTEPGNYDFLCTFPGHYLIGMRGIMVVK